MLKRDFTKSNKNYFAKNKFILISIAVFLLVGILIASIFGFNQNFELNKRIEAEDGRLSSSGAVLVEETENSYGFSNNGCVSFVKNGTNEDFGARPLRRLITGKIEDELADRMLKG